VNGWEVASTAALALAAVTALLVARTAPAHRPVAIFLGIVAAVTAVRWPIAFVLRATPGPYVGSMRALFSFDAALFLIWPFGLAALAVTVFLDRPRAWWAFAAGWAATSAALAWTYPLTRGALLARIYTGLELAAVMIGAGGLIQWAWKREKPMPVHTVTLLIVIMEGAVVAGPYRVGLFTSWLMARVAYVVAYCAVTAVQGGVWWNKNSQRS